MAMDQIKAAVDDLIEETQLRALNDDQIEWRLRKFTETCEEAIERQVASAQKRKMLLDRLQILKCFYDHSSVKHYSGGKLPAREADERERNRRLENIVRRRRMALEMIERADPQVADQIRQRLEQLFSRVRLELPPIDREGRPTGSEGPAAHHWYFLYFNLFLLGCLVTAILFVVR